MKSNQIGWWWYGVTAPLGNKAPRPYRGARKANGRTVVITVTVIAALCTALFFIWAQSAMRPAVERLASAHAHQLAARAMNEAVVDVVTDMEITYDDLIHFEKDGSGRITALKTDMVMANRVKTGIHSAALDKIARLTKSDIKIPSGSLMNSELFAGRGPSIRVRLVPLGIVEASFSNQFDAAGINQTRHRILLDIKTEVGVLLPGASLNRQVETQVCIAETIIVGAVPDAYAELNKNPVFAD